MERALVQMRSSVIGEVQAYWEALRAGRPVPLRSEVDPRGIERALEYSFLLERVAPSIARFRLAGMHLSDLMGMEVRGMPLTSFFAPQARDRIAEILESVFQGPDVAELTLEAEAGIGKPPLTAKMLILPLKSDLGDVTRALGCLVADGGIGRAPRRFELTGVKLVRAVAGRIIALNGAAPAPTAPADLPAPAAIKGFAEPVAAYSPTTEPRGRGAHLRLVKSDD